MIWGQFRATGKLVSAFFTCFGFLTIRVNLKQNDSCAECFDANFEQQDNFGRCFGQVLALEEMSPISSKTTVSKCDLGPISTKRTVAHDVLEKF